MRDRRSNFFPQGRHAACLQTEPICAGPILRSFERRGMGRGKGKGCLNQSCETRCQPNLLVSQITSDARRNGRPWLAAVIMRQQRAQAHADCATKSKKSRQRGRQEPVEQGEWQERRQSSRRRSRPGAPSARSERHEPQIHPPPRRTPPQARSGGTARPRENSSEIAWSTASNHRQRGSERDR